MKIKCFYSDEFNKLCNYLENVLCLTIYRSSTAYDIHIIDPSPTARNKIFEYIVDYQYFVEFPAIGEGHKEE